MAIIVSKDRKDAQRLEPTEFGLESEIQEYIYDNPGVIPLYDIDADIRLFVAAREFPTKSGPIDALGFDQHGNIYVVETKLYRNPDKRTVVAQALDYGASLWRHSTNFENFVLLLDRQTKKQFGVDFEQKYADFFGLDDATDMMVAIKDNLNSGTIKFVVLMDSLHDRLKDLIVYVNQNSQFDIYAATLEYYKHAEFEIIIPKLFGDEVKKEVVSARATGGYAYEDIDRDQFIGSVQARTDLGDKAKKTLLELHDLYRDVALTVDGSVFYYYSPKANRAGFGLNGQDGKQTNLLLSNGEIWAYAGAKTGKMAEFNTRVLNRLIDEKLLDKTEKNLTASQWSVRYYDFTRFDSDERAASQLRRFVEICQEEAARL